MANTNPTEVAEAPQVPVTRHLGWALALISVTQLLIVLDGSIVTIALPFIGADLDMSGASLTWLTIGYALFFGGLLLLGGRLGDMFGYRRMLVTGMVGFAVASVLGGLAANGPLLLAVRILQGSSAALIAPAALALVTTTFPLGAARNRAFGVYAAMSGAGAGIGLIIGGWLTSMDSFVGIELDGWRLTFLLNVPIALAIAVLAPKLLHESPRQRGLVDVPGTVTGSLGIVGLVYGLTRPGEGHGWDDPATIGTLAVSVAMLVIFVLIERRAAHPLLPLRIFRNRVRAGGYLALTLAMASMFAMFYFLTLFVQQILGYSPLRTGIAFLPFALGIVVTATVAGRAMTRIQPRIIAGIGSLLAAFSMAMFSRLSVDDSPVAAALAATGGTTVGGSVSYWGQVFPYLITMAVGMGMVLAGLTPASLYRLAPQDTGVGSGLFNAAQQLGGSVGLAVLSSVSLYFAGQRTEQVLGPITTALPGDPDAVGRALLQATFTEGVTHAFLVGSILLLIASLIVWTTTRVQPNDAGTNDQGMG
ncbi:MFS transporter [Micromonospora hortensis]|uniref:MFS transporter n=1 Tax=Micromonospora hortensis TaxID=2911209 RepID=UPI001EE93B35|nr:MFS transporter [Micromonospora hortensis]MCG5449408.1 MFS transporter [Micromonospora hortensis]